MKKLMLMAVLTALMLVQGCYNEVYKEFRVKIVEAEYRSQLPAAWQVTSALGTWTASREQSDRTLGLIELLEYRRRKLYLDAHPEISDEPQQKIADGEIWYGMNIWAYRAVRGSAYRTNLSSGTWGTRTQLVYGEPGTHRSYAYFVNDKYTGSN